MGRGLGIGTCEGDGKLNCSGLPVPALPPCSNTGCYGSEDEGDQYKPSCHSANAVAQCAISACSHVGRCTRQVAKLLFWDAHLS